MITNSSIYVNLSYILPLTSSMECSSTYGENSSNRVKYIIDITNSQHQLEKKSGVLLIPGEKGFKSQTEFMSIIGQQVPRFLTKKKVPRCFYE